MCTGLAESSRGGIPDSTSVLPVRKNHGLRSRIDGPDLLLRCLAASFPARSAFLLRYRYRFAPESAASSLLARCSSACRSTGRFAGLHSPLGILPPSGSKRSTGFAACRPAFRIRPIPSRSPLPSSFKCGCGSPFLVRYVSGGLLFLKPLGTSFTMLPKSFSVNAFLRLRAQYPQVLFVLFLTDYRHKGVTILWINQSG